MPKPKPQLSKKQVVQKFMNALSDKTLPRKVGNAVARTNPKAAVMGGNTKLNPQSMKAIALTTGRPSNLKHKTEFTHKGKVNGE